MITDVVQGVNANQKVNYELRELYELISNIFSVIREIRSSNNKVQSSNLKVQSLIVALSSLSTFKLGNL